MEQELEFAGQCLRVDAKNYHAWSHRQAVVGAFQLWHQELAFVEALLQDDPANNSTWNQRFFCISHLADRCPRLLSLQLQYLAAP